MTQLFIYYEYEAGDIKFTFKEIYHKSFIFKNKQKVQNILLEGQDLANYLFMIATGTSNKKEALTKDIIEWQKATFKEIAKKDYEIVIKDLKGVIITDKISYKGSYYAHEYDKWAKGKMVMTKYSNGFEEYEVKCLNKELIVADGLWQEPDNNGMGDLFVIGE